MKKEILIFSELIKLIEKWQKEQWAYEEMVEIYENRENFETARKYVYKAQATRDCWKELHNLINAQNTNK